MNIILLFTVLCFTDAPPKYYSQITFALIIEVDVLVLLPEASPERKVSEKVNNGVLTSVHILITEKIPVSVCVVTHIT